MRWFAADSRISRAPVLEPVTLLNIQFQYIDVGTNVEIAPRVHPNHEVSWKVSVEVSSVTSQQNLGGIKVLAPREHPCRLYR
jgi:hypothetical protein